MTENATPDQNQPEGNPRSVQIGNASNPSPNTNEERTTSGQLLPKEAEKYLREVASIEDEPDARDQQKMDEAVANDEQSSE